MEPLRTFKKQMKASMLLAIFWICYAEEDNHLVGSSATPRTDTFIFVVSCFHPFHLSFLLWQWHSFQLLVNTPTPNAKLEVQPSTNDLLFNPAILWTAIQKRWQVPNCNLSSFLRIILDEMSLLVSARPASIHSQAKRLVMKAVLLPDPTDDRAVKHNKLDLQDVEDKYTITHLLVVLVRQCVTQSPCRTHGSPARTSCRRCWGSLSGVSWIWLPSGTRKSFLQ